jgi:hypothetical protein
VGNISPFRVAGSGAFFLLVCPATGKGSLLFLSTVQHTRTLERARRYKVESYVVIADIYGHPPHEGRDG